MDLKSFIIIISIIIIICMWFVRQDIILYFVNINWDSNNVRCKYLQY